MSPIPGLGPQGRAKGRRVEKEVRFHKRRLEEETQEEGWSKEPSEQVTTLLSCGDSCAGGRCGIPSTRMRHTLQGARLGAM